MDSNRTKIRRIVSIIVEHLLLGIAVVFLIPPIPSMEGEAKNYSFWIPLIPMLAFLSGSRYLAYRCGEETWLGWILKTIIFVAAGFVIYDVVKHF